MTGFGCGKTRNEQIEISVEITSLNSRNLEVTFSSPKEWMGLEHIFIRHVRKNLQRGKVRVVLQAEFIGAKDALNWDDAEVSELVVKLKRLSKKLGSSFEVNPTLLLEIVRTLFQKSDLPHWETVQVMAEEALDVALDHLQTMRAEEGKALTKDIRSRLFQLVNWLDEIREEVPKVVPSYQDLLLRRLAHLGTEIDLNDERILKEIAIFADRCDVAEEITRMDSHLKQLEDFLEEDGPVGRKIDFLIQEMNREINTLGAKANFLPINRRVIAVKSELERLREQVHNLE